MRDTSLESGGRARQNQGDDQNAEKRPADSPTHPKQRRKKFKLAKEGSRQDRK